MPMTIAMRNLYQQMAVGETHTPFNSANARIGVGDGTTAFDVNQTDLQGTNKFRKSVDSGYPTRSGNVLTFRATFGDAEANFAWREWGIFNAGTGGTMMCRKVENLGTKSGGSWQLTVTFTLDLT